jgi:hypothetical protein
VKKCSLFTFDYNHRRRYPGVHDFKQMTYHVIWRIISLILPSILECKLEVESRLSLTASSFNSSQVPSYGSFLPASERPSLRAWCWFSPYLL